MTKILLVEDNHGFRELFKECLKEYIQDSSIKVTVVEAQNPIEGLQICTKHDYDFDFIVCDFFLPIQNGLDFLEIVKTHGKRIKCLLISAEQSSRLKISPYIDKFFLKSDMESLVKYLEEKIHSGY